MFEQEDNSCPYDNVEFPIRQSGTGTWPGPSSGSASTLSSSSSSSSSSSPSGGAKYYGQHSLSRAGGVSRLAPLVEVEGAESGDQGQSQKSLDSIIVTSTSTTSSSSSSSTQSFPQNSMPGFGGKALSSNSTSSVNKTSQNTLVNNNTNATATSSMVTASVTISSTAKSSPKATTTTVSSTTTTSSSTATKQNASKPVISVTNDSNLYMATQVTSPNDSTLKKKASSLKCLDAEEEDFKRHDFNPGSRLALEKVYTCHPDFYQLNSKILDEGSLLKQDVLDIFRKSGESLTYEQLLQGMLVDGERFLLGSCWLYYIYVQFLDVEGTKILRQPYGRGRVGLTSKRALFLSTETYTDASLEPYGDPTKRKEGGYKLEVSKQSNVVFKNIPLSNFHSAEMEVVSGTSVLTKITKRALCFGCFGTSNSQWETTPPTTRSVNSRVLRVGVSMPPWQTRMFMDIYLDPSMSLTVARDFISQLHSFAPHMH